MLNIDDCFLQIYAFCETFFIKSLIQINDVLIQEGYERFTGFYQVNRYFLVDPLFYFRDMRVFIVNSSISLRSIIPDFLSVKVCSNVQTLSGFFIENSFKFNTNH